MRFLRWAGIALGLLLVVLFAVVAIIRRQPPTDEQVAAMRVLAAPTPPVAGRDGSDAIWLSDRDVPVAERAAVAAAARRFAERRLAADFDKKTEEDPRSRYPAYPTPEHEEVCKMTQSCLAFVRRDPAAVATMLAMHAAPLRVAEELVAFDGMRVGVTPTISPMLEIPSYGRGGRLVFTALADRFARGERDAALAGTCDQIATMRRLGTDNDMIIGVLVGTAFAHRYLELLSDMLAELPADAPLPPACAAALAPTRPQEFDVCPAVRTEYAVIASSVTFLQQAGEPSPAERMRGLIIDEDHFRALIAPAFARLCAAPARALAAADKSTVAKAGTACSSMETLADPFVCSVAQVAMESPANLLDRRTDLAAALALMRTRLWLRAQSPDPAVWPALLPKRPDSLGLRRTPTISADGAFLEMPLLVEDHDRKVYSLALKPRPLDAED